MKKITIAVLLCSLIGVSAPAVASAQSVSSNYVMKQNELGKAKEKAIQEIASINNLGSLSTNSKKFKEVTAILNKVSASTSKEELYIIMLNIAGTSANKEMVTVKTKVTQEIAALTNLGSLSSNSKEFKEVTSILNQVNASTSIEKIYTILDEVKAEVAAKKELETAKVNAIQKIAAQTNLGSLPTDSKEFKQASSLITQISNAKSVQEVEAILSNM